MALAIVAEGNAACKIAYCRVCLDVFRQNVGRGRKRKTCLTCRADRKPPRLCERCGSMIKPGSYREKFCSHECYLGTNGLLPPKCVDCAAPLPHRKRQRCAPCAKLRKRNVGRGKPRSRLKIHVHCQKCGTAFRPLEARKNKYCSHQCAFEQQRVDRRAAKEARKASRPGPHSKVHECFCKLCSAKFYGKNKNAALCSDACRKKLASAKDREQRKKLRIIAPKSCKECGAEFVAMYGDKRTIYCSKKCSNKAGRRVGKPKERARLKKARVESVDPFKVFDRDGWRCQICHRTTPRRLRGSLNDNAPELDHIVPLARGGEHSYRNTQCACRKCNSRKSDSIYGQLHLFVA